MLVGIRFPIEIDSFYATLTVSFVQKQITRVSIHMGDQSPQMGVVVYLTTLVLCDGFRPLLPTVIATIKISIYSRPSIYNEERQEEREKYVNAFIIHLAKIEQLLEKQTGDIVKK